MFLLRQNVTNTGILAVGPLSIGRAQLKPEYYKSDSVSSGILTEVENRQTDNDRNALED